MTSALRLLLWAAGGAGALLVVLMLGMLAVGGKAAVVASGSMSPALETGDVVVVLPQPVAQARIGDVVVLGAADGSGRAISHRLVDRRTVDGDLRLTTQGDANPTSEDWTLDAADEVGRVALRLQGVGTVIGAARGGVGGFGLVLVPAVVLLLVELVDIWRPQREPAVAA